MIPVCDSVPDLIWNEDENTILNLSNYCYDPDGNNLSFFVERHSNGDHIFIDGNNFTTTGIANFSTDQENWNGEGWIFLKLRIYILAVMFLQII